MKINFQNNKITIFMPEYLDKIANGLPTPDKIPVQTPDKKNYVYLRTVELVAKMSAFQKEFGSFQGVSVQPEETFINLLKVQQFVGGTLVGALMNSKQELCTLGVQVPIGEGVNAIRGFTVRRRSTKKEKPNFNQEFHEEFQRLFWAFVEFTNSTRWLIAKLTNPNLYNFFHKHRFKKIDLSEQGCLEKVLQGRYKKQVKAYVDDSEKTFEYYNGGTMGEEEDKYFMVRVPIYPMLQVREGAEVNC